MPTSRLVDQEFVAHLFAPLDGPNAAAAGEQLHELWAACGTQLGMTQPIRDAGLAKAFPADPGDRPEGALAGLQDPAVDFQAVLRREGDVLNFSLAMSAPRAVPKRRRGVASAAPSGWWEFTRWWGQLTAGGTGALLGAATLYLAKARNATGSDVRNSLPPRTDDAVEWWTHGTSARDFPLWDVTPRGTRADRRLVVLAAPDQDARLSRFAWSAGDTALPPLGRYLLHAAELRHQARVRGDGRELIRVRDQAATKLDRLIDLLRDPAAARRAAAMAAELAADEAALAATLKTLRAMAREVGTARAAMAEIVPSLLPADAALADWFIQQLIDDTEFLEAVHGRAERMRDTTGAVARPGAPVIAAEAARPEPEPVLSQRVEQRLGFGIDVVDYSSRSTPAQTAVQERVKAMVDRVLDGIGLQLHDTDRQPAGDGMMVVLPARMQSHRVLPALLHGWRAQVMASNDEHPEDPIRLRLSVSAGPFTEAAIGFSGNTIIEIGRLLDSAVLRAAVAEHPSAQLVALVSDRLHEDVVGEGYPGLDPGQFEDQPVKVKGYDRKAWLWLGGSAPARSGPVPVLVRRAVFVIHGGDERVRRAVFGLLRDLDLRPVDWTQLVARAGLATGPLLQRAFTEHQAAVVVINVDGDAPRHPGLLVEAGMALGLHRDRTVVLEIGGTRPVTGPEAVVLDGSRQSFTDVAERLRSAGCELAVDDPDWQDPGRFTGLAC